MIFADDADSESEDWEDPFIDSSSSEDDQEEAIPLSGDTETEDDDIEDCIEHALDQATEEFDFRELPPTKCHCSCTLYRGGRCIEQFTDEEIEENR